MCSKMIIWWKESLRKDDVSSTLVKIWFPLYSFILVVSAKSRMFLIGLINMGA